MAHAEISRNGRKTDRILTPQPVCICQYTADRDRSRKRGNECYVKEYLL